MLTAIRRYWLPLTVIQLVAITILSLLPLPELPPLPGNDKTHHLIAYASLMLPVAFVRPRHWMLLAMGFVVWSGVIELIQPSVNRYGEWLDLVANSIGILLGYLLALLMRRLG
nr:VanZ family protein [Arenicella xantha]